MRTPAFVIGTLLVSVSSLVAQTDVGSAIESATARCAFTDCIVKTTVLNAPFSAEATTAWQPPAGSGLTPVRATARYYRDSAGRVRVEQSFVGQGTVAQHIILAPDPDSSYVLDPSAKTVTTSVPRGFTQMMVGDGGYYQFVFLKSMRRFISFFVVPDTVESVNGPSEESLGQHSIEGIRVSGKRFVTRVPGFDNGRAERSVSPELRLVVYSRSEDTRFGMIEYQLTNISRAEPQTELFEVPKEYKEIPFEYPQTWSGPYAPERSNTK